MIRMKRSTGNGDSKHEIVMQEMGPGWVVFRPANHLDLGPQHAFHLHLFFQEWLKANPQVRVRATCPISDETGQTVIVHLWFD
jgi:hypothetical protein